MSATRESMLREMGLGPLWLRSASRKRQGCHRLNI